MSKNRSVTNGSQVTHPKVSCIPAQGVVYSSPRCCVFQPKVSCIPAQGVVYSSPRCRVPLTEKREVSSNGSTTGSTVSLSAGALREPLRNINDVCSHAGEAKAWCLQEDSLVSQEDSLVSPGGQLGVSRNHK
ncbi:hypothetical protein KUCAC02_035731 [Chaenocephalus aceratus]|nr:hypothetical protein KUCAC02_035731 [Chaenocephalus aceratus]